AYILSQKHEGWICLPQMYDDGGISGATMERPALKRLLQDIEANRVDTVVVYKVDRLTRTLGDFAKIVEIFDRHKVSFVSVTQQFNTTTSMGRLTLNMLLSFAQFEREVTGERIRDKIAASKKKGIWMGGNVPLGYDVRERKLIINEAEAATVRHIYRRYTDLGSVRMLGDQLDSDGIVSKRRLDKYGRQTGGRPLARGALYLLLQNRIYIGEIVHKDKSYPGQHDPIIDPVLWDQVQQRLVANRIDRANGAQAASPSLLAGLIYDDTGAPMVPSHANKLGRRYRYYVSKALITSNRSTNLRGRRVPAGDLESLIEGRLTAFFRDQGEVFDVLDKIVEDAIMCRDLTAQATILAGQWPGMSTSDKRKILNDLVERLDLKAESIEIHIRPYRLPQILSANDQPPAMMTSTNGDYPTLCLTIQARLKRVGMETRFIINGSNADNRRRPDRSLLRLLGQAHRFRQMMLSSQGQTMTEIAAEAGVSGSYYTRILRLGFLAPDVVETILRNDHPLDLTAKKLAANSRLPIGWQDQRDSLGINAADT
ncbi:MAG: recombinase family protein, partial [Rhodospirillaceae bacterium]|nr:recombinase family protein [Rhodospirillaceae bacterium]